MGCTVISPHVRAVDLKLSVMRGLRKISLTLGMIVLIQGSVIRIGKKRRDMGSS